MTFLTAFLVGLIVGLKDSYPMVVEKSLLNLSFKHYLLMHFMFSLLLGESSRRFFRRCAECGGLVRIKTVGGLCLHGTKSVSLK